MIADDSNYLPPQKCKALAFDVGPSTSAWAPPFLMGNEEGLVVLEGDPFGIMNDSLECDSVAWWDLTSGKKLDGPPGA